MKQNKNTVYLSNIDEATSLKLLTKNHLKYCQNHDLIDFDLEKVIKIEEVFDEKTQEYTTIETIVKSKYIDKLNKIGQSKLDDYLEAVHLGKLEDQEKLSMNKWGI